MTVVALWPLGPAPAGSHRMGSSSSEQPLTDADLTTAVRPGHPRPR